MILAAVRRTITPNSNKDIKVDGVRLEIYIPFIPDVQSEGGVFIEDNTGRQIGNVSVGQTYILESAGCCACFDDLFKIVFIANDAPIKEITVTQWKEKCCP